MPLPTLSVARERVRAAIASGDQEAILSAQQQVDIWLQVAAGPEANASPELIRQLRELREEIADRLHSSRPR